MVCVRGLSTSGRLAPHTENYLQCFVPIPPTPHPGSVLQSTGQALDHMAPLAQDDVNALVKIKSGSPRELCPPAQIKKVASVVALILCHNEIVSYQ